MLAKPIDHCYWVVPAKLLAGEYPRNRHEGSSPKINAYLNAGITTFIDLTEKDEGLLPYSDLIGSAFHQRFAIRDVSIPHSIEFTQLILDTIDQQILNGQKVYVHCWGGVGRTGVIIGCWLARHSSGGEEGLQRLRELWKACLKSDYRKSPGTLEQERYILNWKRDQ